MDAAQQSTIAVYLKSRAENANLFKPIWLCGPLSNYFQLTDVFGAYRRQ